MEREFHHGEVSLFHLWFGYLDNISFLAIRERMLQE